MQLKLYLNLSRNYFEAWRHLARLGQKCFD